MKLEKLDRTVTYGGRDFAIRVYRDDAVQGTPSWHTVIVENRLPLSHGLGPSTDMDSGFDAALRFVAEVAAAPLPGTVA